MSVASLIDAADDLLARSVIEVDREIAVKSNWDYGADKVIDRHALELIAVYDEVIGALDVAIEKVEAP